GSHSVRGEPFQGKRLLHNPGARIHDDNREGMIPWVLEGGDTQRAEVITHSNPGPARPNELAPLPYYVCALRIIQINVRQGRIVSTVAMLRPVGQKPPMPGIRIRVSQVDMNLHTPEKSVLHTSIIGRCLATILSLPDMLLMVLGRRD